MVHPPTPVSNAYTRLPKERWGTLPWLNGKVPKVDTKARTPIMAKETDPSDGAKGPKEQGTSDSFVGRTFGYLYIR